jgi:ribonuclease E
LRHDEINPEDLQQPSYKMVDVPADEDVKQSAAAEVKMPRQEAAIKGITSDQPAPIVEERLKAVSESNSSATSPNRGGILEKIMSWFRGAPKPQAVVETEKKPRSENAQREGQRDVRRGGRNNRRDEEREGREGREPRGNREPKEGREPRPPQTRDENAKQREPRETKEPREPRRQKGDPRPERKEQVAATPVTLVKTDMPAEAVSETSLVAPEPTQEESGGARRRGRRGGRRERGERSEVQADVQNIEAVIGSTALESSTEPVIVAVAVEPVAAELSPPARPASDTVDRAVKDVEALEVLAEAPARLNVVPVVAEVTKAPAIIEPPANVAGVDTFTPTPMSEVLENPVVPAAIAEATPEKIEVAPPVSATALPVEEVIAPAPLATAEPMRIELPATAAELGKVLDQSGLVMVETSNDKAQSRQAETVICEIAPRPRRKRAVAAPVTDEPLTMVETQK